MINQSSIQNHLNSKYSNKIQTEEIEILANELTGKLKVEDYPNLRKIKISSSVDSKQKGKITKIELIDLDSLEEVSIILCNLEELEFKNCPNVNALRLRQNKLSNLNFLNGLEENKLNYLSIINNNIIEQDLSFFSRFINLETLSIGNEPVSIKEKKGNNQFKGSLEPLKDLTKLKNLHISKTNINEGLDFLPLSIEKIYCDGKTDFVKPRTKSYQCLVIEERLKTGNWRKSQFIENEGYFSILAPKLDYIEQIISSLETTQGKENVENTLRRRFNLNNNQESIQENNQSFWSNPAAANKIACCNVNATIFGGIIALIVGIPAYLALRSGN